MKEQGEPLETSELYSNRSAHRGTEIVELKGISASNVETEILNLGVEKHNEVLDIKETRGSFWLPKSSRMKSGIRLGSLLRTWTEVSKFNYMLPSLSESFSGIPLIRKSDVLSNRFSILSLVSSELRNKSHEDHFDEQFPVRVSPLLKEDNYWGCFYIVPELYDDKFSPVVRIRKLKDIPNVVAGVLTRDMVAACLTYLHRAPMLGKFISLIDKFVLIKLDLSSKHLTNIDVLQHYKYLVHLDLQNNLLTELSVLSHLPYLQYLSVSSNRLDTVLEYDPPQWFLTEVYYKFNSVKKIPDLSMFWSITILDLSNNNIKSINGLQNLSYLRRLDLSFNHIRRLEGLNHLRLVWLDVSYNNVSSFEFGPDIGLWTLLHLEYLNLNENNLSSLKVFAECNRLREVHLRNNRISNLLELALYMKQLRRLSILDLRANPICSASGYTHVIINTFPALLNLDDEELDPVKQRSSKMKSFPSVETFATRRLQRLLYIEQLSRVHVSSYVPPADTTDVPLVVLVGYEAVGKGKLARRLAKECSANIEFATQHTTASYHFCNHYKEITREKFDDMLLAGDFLTYTEANGESYGLSREEAFVRGKVKIVTMDLVAALMLKLRGLRPYLILVSCHNKGALKERQNERKTFRHQEIANRAESKQMQGMCATLQVLLSGRYIIQGILNELLMSLPEDKQTNEFLIESECSLLMDSDVRRMQNLKGVQTTKPQPYVSKSVHSTTNPSLYSLYKGSQATYEYRSSYNVTHDSDENNCRSFLDEKACEQSTDTKKADYISHIKSIDFSRFTSTTWEGATPLLPQQATSSKFSKSVTFTGQNNSDTDLSRATTGLPIDPLNSGPEDSQDENVGHSISKMLPWHIHSTERGSSQEDLDLWNTFLADSGLLQLSAVSSVHDRQMIMDDYPSLITQMEFHHEVTEDADSSTIQDDYEVIHRQKPGLFWDTVTMDNFDQAYNKTKRIIRDIVDSQSKLRPMFDIDFTNLPHYPTVEKRLDSIRQAIAPQRLFY